MNRNILIGKFPFFLEVNVIGFIRISNQERERESYRHLFFMKFLYTNLQKLFLLFICILRQTNKERIKRL